MEPQFSALILSAERASRAHGADRQASEALFAALYRELRGLARRELARSGPGAALGATSLLHEAYLDIAQREGLAFPDRARFLTYAARVMRGLIIDGLRSRQARKRGGGFEITSIDGKDVGGAARRAMPRRSSGSARRSTSSPPWSRRSRRSSTSSSSAVSPSPRSRASAGSSERTVQRHWDKARIYLRHALRDRGLLQ